jgi:DNA-binding protein H-NS
MKWLTAKDEENKELAMGIKVEKEHEATIKQIIDDVENDKVQPIEKYQELIAKDHLKESDIYYTELNKMEKKLEKKKEEVEE